LSKDLISSILLLFLVKMSDADPCHSKKYLPEVFQYFIFQVLKSSERF